MPGCEPSSWARAGNEPVWVALLSTPGESQGDSVTFILTDTRSPGILHILHIHTHDQPTPGGGADLLAQRFECQLAHTLVQPGLAGALDAEIDVLLEQLLSIAQHNAC